MINVKAKPQAFQVGDDLFVGVDRAMVVGCQLRGANRYYVVEVSGYGSATVPEHWLEELVFGKNAKITMNPIHDPDYKGPAL